MSKHDEAKRNVEECRMISCKLLSPNDRMDLNWRWTRELEQYITKMEAMEKELKELKRDVKEYFKYVSKFKELTKEKQIKIYQLQEKLSKVGDEE